jgi:FtsP/CotA-like multicopper oxidase with cupredoxin domain
MSRDDRTVLGWGAFVVAIAALFLAVFAVLHEDGSEASDTSGGGGGGGGGASAEVSNVSVSLTEFKITPAEITVPAGDVSITVTNDGTVAHNFALPDLGVTTADILPGQSETLELTVEEGTYKTVCTIAGHEAAGMVGTLVVTAAGDTTPTTAGESSGEDGGLHGGYANWQEMDYAMEARAKAFPAETLGGPGGQILEPEVEADGTKVFRLTVEEVDWEVEPGKIVRAKTYNGMVPGPEIRVDVGDRVKLIVTNNLQESTSVHWHGVRVPNLMDGVDPYTQAPIVPGETFTYEFTTIEPAVGIYHSHHDAQVQIPDGMFGAFMVGTMPIPQAMIDKGYTEVDQEVTMVLNDAGVIGLSLNGKSFPATQPYQMMVGDVMMVHYQNEGLQGHPMHMHQPSGWIIAKDGVPLEVPMPSDTIWVSPGERYTVLYKATDPGVWAWHCHILSHAEGPQGMFGMVTALIVTPNAGPPPENQQPLSPAGT